MQTCQQLKVEVVKNVSYEQCDSQLSAVPVITISRARHSSTRYKSIVQVINSVIVSD